MQLARLVFIVNLTLTLLVACGGGGGGGGGNAPAPLPQTGQFIDSPVGGLTYSCVSPNGSSQTNTGTTNGLGQFTFTAGQTCKFTIGNVTIGSMSNIPTDGVVTPQDVAGVSRSVTSDPAAVAIAQFLQTLDDGSGSGNIVIPTAVTAALSNSSVSPITLVSSTAGVVSQSTLTNLVQTVGQSVSAYSSKPLVSASTATSALQSQIASGKVNASGGAVNANSPITLTSIVVTSSATSNPAGIPEQLTATGNYSDGTSKDLTSKVTWASSDTSTLTVDLNGSAVGIVKGTAVVTASFTPTGVSTSVSGSFTQTVTDPTVLNIVIATVSNAIQFGATTALSAIETFSNNVQKTVTSLVNWLITPNTGNASISVDKTANTATLTGTTSGDMNLNASYQGVSSNSISVTVAEQPLLSTQAISLPDINDKAATICAGNLLRVNARIKTANLTKHTDRRRDLIVMISCQTLPYGAVSNNSFPSGILEFSQQSDGTFRDDTSKIFGSEILITDGVLFNAVSNDFNNDGYDDLVISVSSEDGRVSYNNAQYQKKQLALTSNGDGTYRSELIGGNTLDEIIQVVNNNGIKEVLIASYGGGIDQAFRYTNNQWVTSNYYTNITGNNPWAGWSSLPMSGSFYSTTNGNINEGLVSDYLNNVYLFSKPTLSGGWSSIDKWALPVSQTVNYTDWIGTTGSLSLYKINGKDMGFLAFNVSCQITYSNANQPTSVFMTNAQQINGGYKGQSLTLGTSDFIADTIFIALDEVNGKIVQRNVTFTGSITGMLTTNHLQCEDYTGDGKKDIFVSTWGGNPKPIIYIDTGSGAYSLVKQSKFPDNGSGNGIYYSIYEDIDGDGINDLVYFPTQLQTTKVDGIRLYKGMRKILSTDLN